MNTSKIAALAALIALCSGSYVLGQATQPTNERELLKAFYASQTNPEAYDQLMSAYAEMPGNASATNQAARIGLLQGEKGNTGPGFAALIVQNQKLIEQNARIIELLEKQSAKEK